MTDGSLHGIVRGLTAVAPGAAVAVLADGQLRTACAGVTDVRAPQPVEASTLFQIGSVTKVHTATLLCLAAADGLVELDAPVTTVLPDLRVAGEPVPDSLTVRTTICHRVGFDDPPPGEWGEDDDAIARFVDDLAAVGWLTAPGVVGSYSNAGFVLAGRLLEVLHAKPFHRVLQDHLFHRAGLADHVHLPEDVRRRPHGHGHVPGPDGPVSTPEWALPAAIAPAGALTCATAADLVRFGALHIDGGPGPIPASWRKAMRSDHGSIPGRPGHSGLGWGVTQVGDEVVLRHDGGTNGSSSRLVVLPELGVVIAVLTNHALVHAAFDEPFRALLEETAGLVSPQSPAPGAVVDEGQMAGFAGAYRREGSEVTVEVTGGSLRATSAMLPVGVDLTPIDAGAFSVDIPGLGPLAFVFTAGTPDGPVDRLHVMGRVHVRT